MNWRINLKALLALAFLGFTTSAFGSVITLNGIPTAGANSVTVGSAVEFINAAEREVLRAQTRVLAPTR